MSKIRGHENEITYSTSAINEAKEKLQLIMKCVEEISSPDLSSLENILHITVKLVNRSGLIILQTEPGNWINGRYEGGRLHTVAVWPRGHGAWFPACIASSQTKAASVLGPAAWISNDKNSPTVFYREYEADSGHPRHSILRRPDKGDRLQDDLFVRDGGHIRSAIFIPVDLFLGLPSILCIYDFEHREFEGIFFNNLRMALKLLSKTFHSVLNGVAYRLISEVNEVLTAAAQDLGDSGLKTALARIPDRVAKALCCRTVAMVLADDTGQVGTVYCNGSDGMTDLETLARQVLRGGRPVLAMHESPEAAGAVPAYDQEASSQLFVPILRGTQTMAVMACERRQGVPRVLTGWEQNLLSIIGAHVVKSWTDARTKELLKAETNSWKAAVNLIANANARVYGVIKKESADLDAILKQMLDVVSHVVGRNGDDCWLAIRLLNADESSLEYRAIVGDRWERNPKLLTGAFPTAPDAEGLLGLGAWVAHNRQVWASPNTSNPSTLPPGVRACDPPATQIVVIPILGGKREKVTECFGVVDVHMSKDRRIPDHFLEMAEMLGHQIGLLVFLTRRVREILDRHEAVIRKLREAEELARLNLEVMQNIHHQVDSPMVTAIWELDRLLSHFRTRPQEFDKLRAVRAFVKRSWQASSSANIFRSLTSGKDFIQAYDLVPMTDTAIENILQEAAEDFRHIIDAERRIKIGVDFSEVKGVDLRRFWYHEKLLNQMVGNLLDNANKYSFNGRPIHIIGGLSKTNNFSVSIRNFGIPILPNEAGKIKERSYRSETAKQYAEGTGIGLWLVDQIMIRLGGAFEIIPATESGQYHEFKLVFKPRRRAEKGA